MPQYSVTIVHGGGRAAPLPVVNLDLRAVLGLALDRARHLVAQAGPSGDGAPPQRVEVRDRRGALVISVTIDESLRPMRQS